MQKIIMLLFLFFVPLISSESMSNLFIKANMEQEPYVYKILLKFQKDKNIQVLQKYLEEHPENICIHQAFLQCNNFSKIRRFYLLEQRKYKIKRENKKTHERLKMKCMAIYYFIGNFYKMVYEQNKQKNFAFLSLLYFQKCITLSADFLPAWVKANTLLKQLGGEKNIQASTICKHNIKKIWYNSNPTFFRIAKSELEFPSQKSKQKKIKGSQQSFWPDENIFSLFLEEKIKIHRLVPKQSTSEVKAYIQIANYFFHQSRKQNLILRKSSLHKSLKYILFALTCLRKAQEKKETKETMEQELLIRKYLAHIYYTLEKYALAEEECFMIKILESKE